MGVPKVAGLETEFGLIVADSSVDPITASHLIVNGWPYGVAYSGGLPVGDRMLPNGARLYVDHAHPEYSTAEALHPRTVVAADKAGELIVNACSEAVRAAVPSREIVLFKTNTNRHGTSFGCHENYLLEPATYDAIVGESPSAIQAAWVAFLVTRTLLCGSGKVGSERGEPCGYQLSQRADFMESLRGLQTTYCRPLVNTRDEAHADRSRFRRLHVIAGDANMSELSAFLKVGTSQLMLAMAEEGRLPHSWALADPVAAARTVSRDLTFASRLPLTLGGSATAVEIQYRYLGAAIDFLADRPEYSAWHDVVELWGRTLDAIAHDWQSLATQIDWAIKRALLERLLERHASSWDAVVGGESGDGSVEDLSRHHALYDALRRIDIEYHEVRINPQRPGLFYRLQACGGARRLLDDAEVAALVHLPPRETRAWDRGRLIAACAGRVRSADWEDVVVGDDALDVSIPLVDPAASRDGGEHV